MVKPLIAKKRFSMRRKSLKETDQLKKIIDCYNNRASKENYQFLEKFYNCLFNNRMQNASGL